MSRPTVLVHCQHSLGLGHLVRTLALAGALAERFRVVLLNGGRMPRGLPVPPGVEVISLPPLGMSVDGVLSSLDGRRSAERALTLRREQVLAAHAALRPAVVVVELFPFGRRKFRGELVALLEAARGTGALVVSSVRDILVTSKRDQAAHDERAAALANAYFDLVLVHSDPRFARLEESFRPATPLRVPVRHTGFVVPARDDRGARPGPPRARPRVIVSAGGGRYGETLLAAAAEAHRIALAADGVDLRLIAGPFLPEPAYRALRAAARAGRGLEVRRVVPDLLAELSAADASVSQCGYNTALDVVRAGVPALVAPFAEGDEDEQTRRAERLAGLGAVRVLAPERLDGATLAAEIRALLRFRPAPARLAVDGARETARIVAEALDGVTPARAGSDATATAVAS